MQTFVDPRPYVGPPHRFGKLAEAIEAQGFLRTELAVEDIGMYDPELPAESPRVSWSSGGP